jgi:hypothetical protein
MCNYFQENNPQFKLKDNYNNIIVISTIIFAFYTTSYFSVFSGEVGLKLTKSFNYDKNKTTNDLVFITNYFRLGCYFILILIILILIFSTFSLNNYIFQLIIGYFFSISLFFLWWIFNIIFNLISTIIHKLM